MKARLSRVFGVLASILFGLLLLEVGLRVVDPWGAWDYFGDLGRLADGYTMIDGGGCLPSPGQYVLSHSTVTVGTDRHRVVPDTNPDATCTIAAIGDSVTFGHGVDDDETWVNLLARQFPDVRFVNAGVNGYALSEIAWALESTPADGYIYLFSYNDTQVKGECSPPRLPSAIVLYAILVTSYSGSQEEVLAARADVFGPDFWEALERVAGREDVLLLDYTETALSEEMAGRYPDMVRFEWWTENNSFIDPHPNPEGHAEIAERIAPYVGAWLETVCE